MSSVLSADTLLCVLSVLASPFSCKKRAQPLPGLSLQPSDTCRKGTAVLFVQESNYLMGSGDAGVPNTVCNVQPPMKRVSPSIQSALQMNFITGKSHSSYMGSVVL